MYQTATEYSLKNCSLKDINPLKVSLYDSSASQHIHISRTYNCSAIFYVSSGEIFFQDSKSEHIVNEGQCFFANPGVQLSLRSTKKSLFKCISIEFSGDFQKKFEILFKSNAIDVPKTIFNEIINTCTNSLQTDTLGYFISSQLLRLYFELSTKQTHYRDFVKKQRII